MNGRKVYSEILLAGFDAALFLDETSSFYLGDFYSTDGALIVSSDETALFIDSRYYEAATNAKKNGTMESDVFPYLFVKQLFGTLSEYFSEKQIKRVCLDPGLITVSQVDKLRQACPGTEFGFLPDVCLKYRRVKSAKEIEKIRHAQEITDAAFSHILGFIAKGKTEIEVAAELEYFMRSHGASGMAFDTIAVSGRNSSLPHGVPGNNVLTENSFFTMDFGAKFEGYCSDMTRTVVLGSADAEMKHIYETVLLAQNEAMKFIKAGVTGAEADKVARDIISDAGYGSCFGHSLGHSLGLMIHELPALSTRSTDTLVSGNIVTVEPGIYIPGKYGVRIENMVLVTENGCKNLTNSDRSLLEI